MPTNTFDPDAYLTQKSESASFNPDAYLSMKIGSAGVVSASTSKEVGAQGGISASPDKVDAAMQKFDVAHPEAAGYPTLKEIAANPTEALTTVGGKTLSTATFGQGRLAAANIESKLTGMPVEQVLAKYQAREQANPKSAALGSTLGGGLNTAATVAATTPVLGPLALPTGIASGSVAQQIENTGKVEPGQVLKDEIMGLASAGAIKRAVGAAPAPKTTSLVGRAITTAAQDAPGVGTESRLAQATETANAEPNLAADLPSQQEALKTLNAASPKAQITRQNIFKQNADAAVQQAKNAQTAAETAVSQAKKTAMSVLDKHYNDTKKTMSALGEQRNALFEAQEDQPNTGSAQHLRDTLAQAVQNAPETAASSARRINSIVGDLDTTLTELGETTPEYRNAKLKYEALVDAANKDDATGQKAATVAKPDPQQYISQADELRAMAKAKTALNSVSNYDKTLGSTEASKYMNQANKLLQDHFDPNSDTSNIPQETRQQLQDINNKFADAYNVREHLKDALLIKKTAVRPESGQPSAGSKEYIPDQAKLNRTLASPTATDQLTRGLQRALPEESNPTQTTQTIQNAAQPPQIPETTKNILALQSAPQQSLVPKIPVGIPGAGTVNRVAGLVAPSASPLELLAQKAAQERTLAQPLPTAQAPATMGAASGQALSTQQDAKTAAIKAAFPNNSSAVMWLQQVAKSPQTTVSQSLINSTAKQAGVPPEKIADTLIKLGKQITP